jgi:glycine/D-amino acid oxidase-like deaminating enzyme
MSGAVPDVLVVGAGVVGAACAYELARGGLRVSLVEEDVVGGGATAAGMGHLVALDGSDHEFDLSRFSQELWAELLPQMPREVEHLECGTLWVAADEEELREARRKHGYNAAHGVASEMLDGKQLAEAEPELRAGLAGGLVAPGDSVIYAPAAAAWLVARSGAAVTRGRVVRLSGRAAWLSDGTRLEAGSVVNAAGAKAAHLTSGVPVTPRKGHLLITDRYPGFLRHQLVELGYMKSAHASGGESVAFNAQPRKTGQVLLGSSRQHGVEDGRIERGILTRMMRRALEYLPGISALEVIRCWTGFRAATPDGAPLIGPWPEEAGLWLAAGHEGLGITTAPATGRLLADLMLGRPPCLAPEPFLPARFWHG